MNTENDLIKSISSQKAESVFTELYGTENIGAAQQRYSALAEQLLTFEKASELVPSGNPLRFFSAPGRTELAGNHTDHNHGKVLAAAIHLDNAAIAIERADKKVFFRSAGFPDSQINLLDGKNAPDLLPHAEEAGKTNALIRGIAAQIHKRGIKLNGFTAFTSSTVLPGSGLSSSAAVEVLIARIFDCLYNKGALGAQEIARMGQIAENDFFNKPCGLMDQTACASGGAVAIDFGKISGTSGFPQMRNIDFNLSGFGYALCVINTGGSHADLTPDYAAIPGEMKAVAAFFGKTVLAELKRETIVSAAADLRKHTGDRALLRAMHFFDENERVDEMVLALEQNAFTRYLELVNESGASSWQILQNVYSSHNVREQSISTALALTKNFLKQNRLNGAYRVHGGGFAGTIQVYIPADALRSYRDTIEKVFGKDSLSELRIRSAGALELLF